MASNKYGISPLQWARPVSGITHSLTAMRQPRAGRPRTTAIIMALDRGRLISGMGYDRVSMNVAAVRRPGGLMYSGLRETLAGLGEMIAEIRRM